MALPSSLQTPPAENGTVWSHQLGRCCLRMACEEASASAADTSCRSSSPSRAKEPAVPSPAVPGGERCDHNHTPNSVMLAVIRRPRVRVESARGPSPLCLFVARRWFDVTAVGTLAGASLLGPVRLRAETGKAGSRGGAPNQHCKVTLSRALSRGGICKFSAQSQI